MNVKKVRYIPYLVMIRMDIKQDNVYSKYHDDVLILLKTGLRISELCGLTKNDLDFKNHAFRITHQLLKDKDGFYIAEPKTKSGFRNVPMSEETEKAFHRVMKRKQKPKIKEIDGSAIFCFLVPTAILCRKAVINRC